MGQAFIGRHAEMELLERYYSTEKSEMVAVYGRRRVGKTFLVRSVLEERFDFDFTGMFRVSAKTQRSRFQSALNQRSGESRSVPSDWFEAFDNLKSYLLSLKKDRAVVFLDELPWLDTPKSDFLAALSDFWNNWGSKGPLLKLYVCGSATTWMVDKLIGDRGGLYGRISRSIYLAPFSLLETEEFLNTVKSMNYSREQVLDTYMVFGGIPYYLDMLDDGLPFAANVDNLFFAQNAPLRTEYEFLFRSLFSESSNYRKVVETLSGKLSGLTREDIERETKLTGGALSKILKNLASCDFIRDYSNGGRKERHRVFQLTDLYSLFYLRFVGAQSGPDAHFWTNASRTGTVGAWLGYAFEQVCLHHLEQIKLGLGISGIASNSYAWNCKAFTDEDGTEWKGGQIDLVIDRGDKVMNLCEMKYSQDEYVVSKEYSETLRRRAALFRNVTKTKKSLRTTFITLYGVKRNMYSGIVDNELTLDDLFR